MRLILTGDNAGRVVEDWLADEIGADTVDTVEAVRIVRGMNAATMPSDGLPCPSNIDVMRATRSLAISRIRPIPADRILQDGQVAANADRLTALEAISDKIEALALGPDGRAWTPLHYREFARGELRRAKKEGCQG